MSTDPLSYTQIIAQLRPAYDRSASERDVIEKTEWKLAERQGFLERLRAEGDAPARTGGGHRSG
jgi:hypothetical protein